MVSSILVIMQEVFREQAIGVSNCGCKVGLIYPELRSLRGLRKVRIFPKIDIYNDNGIITHKILWSNWFIKMKSMQIYFLNFGLISF